MAKNGEKLQYLFYLLRKSDVRLTMSGIFESLMTISYNPLETYAFSGLDKAPKNTVTSVKFPLNNSDNYNHGRQLQFPSFNNQRVPGLGLGLQQQRPPFHIGMGLEIANHNYYHVMIYVNQFYGYLIFIICFIDQIYLKWMNYQVFVHLDYRQQKI